MTKNLIETSTYLLIFKFRLRFSFILQSRIFQSITFKNQFKLNVQN
jgi:hypothetical protein